jgi:hypothetical protein
LESSAASRTVGPLLDEREDVKGGEELESTMGEEGRKDVRIRFMVGDLELNFGEAMVGAGKGGGWIQAYYQYAMVMFPYIRLNKEKKIEFNYLESSEMGNEASERRVRSLR